MTYRRYAAYKESGVEWLGDVPRHWETRAVWMLFSLGRGRVISHEEILDNPGEYPVYSSQTEENGEMGRLNTYDFEGNYITWTTDGANAGTVFIRSGRFNCTNVCGTLKAKFDGLNLQFVAYSLSLATPWFVRQDINPKLMNNVMAQIRLPYPCLEEQHAIAAFLDRETAQIDALIARQGRLIAVLQEKRQALISHAVTKGLNPHAPLKESGVEWLGDVPRHWEVKRLKHLLREPMAYGASESGETDDPDSPRFIRITDIDANGNLRSETFRSLPPEIAEPYLLADGDVLFARSGATVGKAFIYRESWGKACFAGYLIRAKPDLDVLDPQWLRYCTQTHFYWQYITAIQIQATIQNVSAERYANLYLPCPPLQEQVNIMHHLKGELGNLASLQKKAEQSIAVLRERRAALIGAAVTGKMDVRG